MKDKLKIKLSFELKVTRGNTLGWCKQLIVKIMHPCSNPCEEELLVYKDYEGNVSNPWIHYSEKVEADLNEFIGIKLAEQREREELQKLTTEERARLEKEKVARILDSY